MHWQSIMMAMQGMFIKLKSMVRFLQIHIHILAQRRSTTWNDWASAGNIFDENKFKEFYDSTAFQFFKTRTK
jgi:hypothetical protein